jgi:hypothetical protein
LSKNTIQSFGSGNHGHRPGVGLYNTCLNYATVEGLIRVFA